MNSYRRSPRRRVFDLWEDVEAQAAEAGWEPGVDAETVWEIVQNARAQRRDASLDDLVDAFAYYFHHDALIGLDDDP